MKRRKLLLGLALAAPPLAAAPTVDAAEFERRIECDRAQADADYAGFLKAAKEARKLFALDECR